MNLERLLSQDPFNKWMQKFLKEYTQNCHRSFIQPIGSAGFRTDLEITDMFMNIMLREKPGGKLSRDMLLQIFYAWYEHNATYHTNYTPPKMFLMERLQQKHRLVHYRGGWCFDGLELAVNTLEEANVLIAANRDNLQYRLPDFQPEPDPEEERRRQELRRAEQDLLIAELNRGTSGKRG